MAEELLARKSQSEGAPTMALTEIMDEEMALSMATSDITSASDSLATRLSRQKLYERYPGSDRNYLDEVFKIFG